MPLFELQGPDGKTYEIDAPSMDAAAAAFQGAQPQPPEQPSTAADMAKSLGSGAVRGAAGIVGMGGDVTKLLGAGLAAGTPNAEAQRPDMLAAMPLFLRKFHEKQSVPIGSQEIMGAIDRATGLPVTSYKPQTTAGEYARTIGEFLPAAAFPGGGIAGRAMNVLAPALGSETAGQLTEGTSAEPWARMGGALAGGMIGPRLITPSSAIAPERAAMAKALENEGVPLTAGQRTGSRPLQWLEQAAADTPLSAGKAAAMNEKQGRAFTGAVLKRMGASGDEIATPAVIDQVVTKLGQTFEDLSARNTLVPDQRFVNDLINTARDYVSKVIPTQRAGGQRNVEAIMNDVVGQMQQNGGIMSGTMYQATRSRLSAMADGVRQSDSQLSSAIKGIQKALDGAMNRSIRPEDRQAWETARKQWGNWKAIEKAITGAGSQTAEGYISPSQLRGAVAAQNRGKYARGQGDLVELARAGEVLLKPLPQSGTAPRQAAGNLFASLGGMGAAGAASGGALLPMILGAAAPMAGARAVLSKPVQSYLGNQILPRARDEMIRNAIIQEILARQALEYQRQ